MTSADPTPYAPPVGEVRRQALGLVALFPALFCLICAVVLATSTDAYVQLFLFFGDLVAVPIAGGLSIVFSILAIRSKVQPNRVLGIVSLVIVGGVLLAGLVAIFLPSW